jgi:hypothetical protein
LLRGPIPIFFRRSVGTAAGLPKFVSQGGNVGMPEGGNAVSDRRSSLVIVRGLRMLGSLPCQFMSGQVILLSLLLGYTMRVSGAILQFGGSLVVLVM